MWYCVGVGWEIWATSIETVPISCCPKGNRFYNEQLASCACSCIHWFAVVSNERAKNAELVRQLEEHTAQSRAKVRRWCCMCMYGNCIVLTIDNHVCIQISYCLCCVGFRSTAAGEWVVSTSAAALGWCTREVWSDFVFERPTTWASLWTTVPQHHTHGQTDWQTDRLTDRQTHTRTHT